MAESEESRDALYVLQQLEARFEVHHTDPNVARGKPYLSGAQVIHRLNTVLGPNNWTHSVLREGVWTESDEIWVYGRLVGWIDGLRFEREDYGSNKITRSKSDRIPTQLGDNHQAAKTDSLKRCAKQLGVGAYLDGAEANDVALVAIVNGELMICSSPRCGKPLDVVRVGGGTWSIQELANRSRALTRTQQNREGSLLCANCYFALRKQRQAEAAGPGVQRGAA